MFLLEAQISLCTTPEETYRVLPDIWPEFWNGGPYVAHVSVKAYVDDGIQATWPLDVWHPEDFDWDLYFWFLGDIGP